MFDFTVKSLSKTITQIIDPTGVTCFLVQGAKRAALIDTGTGLCGLRELVAQLTTLPLTVLLTHGHCDHAGGAGEFDEIYLNAADLPLAANHGALQERMGYARFSMPSDSAFTEQDFAKAFTGEYLPLVDGQLFELGGITLEIIAVSGHTKGSMCILFQEERSILFGDALNVNTLLVGDESTTIVEYAQSLLRLKAREGDYDTTYYSHGPAVGPCQCLDDNIELCERILAGEDDAIPCEFFGMKAYRAAAMDEHFRRLDGKFGNIVYSQAKK
ncbi:MAG: MBL fold metallo-hydrolase [Clostridiales bacterium]|nr:MBL fold metallo-hydrolase [Clostridiales bacterium]